MCTASRYYDIWMNENKTSETVMYYTVRFFNNGRVANPKIFDLYVFGAYSVAVMVADILVSIDCPKPDDPKISNEAFA